MWDEWIVNRAKAAGIVNPYLKDITLPELQYRLCYFILELQKRVVPSFHLTIHIIYAVES